MQPHPWSYPNRPLILAGAALALLAMTNWGVAQGTGAPASAPPAGNPGAQGAPQANPQTPGLGQQNNPANSPGTNPQTPGLGQQNGPANSPVNNPQTPGLGRQNVNPPNNPPQPPGLGPPNINPPRYVPGTGAPTEPRYVPGTGGRDNNVAPSNNRTSPNPSRQAIDNARNAARNAAPGAVAPTQDALNGARAPARDAYNGAQSTPANATDRAFRAGPGAATADRANRAAALDQSAANRADLRAQGMGIGANLGARFFGDGGRLTVDAVNRDSVAARLGLAVGDEIVSVNGQAVDSADAFHRQMVAAARNSAGGRVPVTVRRNGVLSNLYWTETSLSMAGYGPWNFSGANAWNSPFYSPYYWGQYYGEGFGPYGGNYYVDSSGNVQRQPTAQQGQERYQAAYRQNNQRLGVMLDSGFPGAAVVRSVRPGTAAANAELRPGDVIREINGQPVRSIQDVINAVSATQPNQEIRISYIRSEVRTTTTTLTPRGEQSAEPSDNAPRRPASDAQNPATNAGQNEQAQPAPPVQPNSNP